MTRKSGFTAILAGLWIGSAVHAAVPETAGTPPVASDLKPLLEKLAADCRAPGMAALVLRGDTVIARGVTGVRKIGSPEPLTLQDEFHLGSNTKSMTATLAAMYVEEGKLKWSSTVGELFADTGKPIDPAWSKVTLAQVLAHRGGLPANLGPALRARTGGDTPLPAQRLAVITEVLAHPPEYPAGSRMVYSNLGFTLVGVVVERIAGRPWEELMRERLFAPLGIKSAGFGPPGAIGRVEQPWGHTDSRQPVQRDNPAAIGPAGTVHMALGDWARYVTLHLRGDPRNPHHEAKLLKAESFAQLHTPVVEGNYVCGWVAEVRPAAKGDREGDRGVVFWHNGSNTFWYAIMLLAPEVDTAVLLATNCADPATRRACDQTANALLRTYAHAP